MEDYLDMRNRGVRAVLRRVGVEDVVANAVPQAADQQVVEGRERTNQHGMQFVEAKQRVDHRLYLTRPLAADQRPKRFGQNELVLAGVLRWRPTRRPHKSREACRTQGQNASTKTS